MRDVRDAWLFTSIGRIDAYSEALPRSPITRWRGYRISGPQWFGDPADTGSTPMRTQTAGEPMRDRDMEGISAATSASATGKDAGGPGNASGSSDDERRRRESLDVPPDNGISRSPSPDGALPERELPQSPQDPQNPILSPNVARKPPPGWDRERDREDARIDRINEADQAARDRGSLPPRA